MPGSPASSPASAALSHSKTQTRRSTVSAAFNNGPTTEVSSPMSHQSSGGLSKRISVPTVGTIVNPAATASELLAKTPSMSQQSERTKAGSALPTTSAFSGVRPSSSPSQRSRSRSRSQNPAQSQALSELQNQQQPGSVSGSLQNVPPAGSTDASNIPVASNVGHGVVDVNMKRGAIIQICFSLAGFLVYAILWIYLLSYANCYNDLIWDFIMKCIVVAGAVSSFFILAHSCFEHKVSTRGVFGCVIFFIITCVTFLSILVGFKAMNCSCRCFSGENAWALGAVEDLTIFVLSLIGALCLIIVLLVASVAHE